jgi:hypothetical protein
LTFVVAALIVAALLIALPLAMGVPSAGDICNAGSFAERDELEAEKTRAARIALGGALLSSVAAMVASSASSRGSHADRASWCSSWPGSESGFTIGAAVALLTYAVIC